MSKNQGRIFELPDGKFGLALNSEQTPAFSNFGKIYYHIFLDRNCIKPSTDPETGKKYIGVRHFKELKFIGFQD
jgi:hypothetical protein